MFRIIVNNMWHSLLLFALYKCGHFAAISIESHWGRYEFDCKMSKSIDCIPNHFYLIILGKTYLQVIWIRISIQSHFGWK